VELLRIVCAVDDAMRGGCAMGLVAAAASANFLLLNPFAKRIADGCVDGDPAAGLVVKWWTVAPPRMAANAVTDMTRRDELACFIRSYIFPIGVLLPLEMS